MRLKRVMPSTPVFVMAVAIVGVSVASFLVTEHSTTQQERELLHDNANQAASLIDGFLGQTMGVESLATLATVDHGSGPAFTSQAISLGLYRSGQSPVALISVGHGPPTVIAALGSGFSVGETISGAVGKALLSAGAQPSTVPVVHRGGNSIYGFMIGAPATPPGTVIFQQNSLPTILKDVPAGLFPNLDGALYASKSPDSGQLLLATTPEVPISGESAQAHLTIGASTWVLVVKARSPLVGALAASTPWIILGLGLLVAVLVGAAVEVLVRRHRYATRMVEERTEDLKQSVEDLRSAQDALVRNERLAAVGEMASVVGHELRNPLTAVNNALYLVRLDLDDLSAARVEPHLAMAEREVGKAATLAQDLTDFVRPREPVPEPFALEQVLEEVLSATPIPPGVEVACHVDRVTLVADRGQFAEVLTNLIENACQAMGEQGRLTVEATADAQRAVVSVKDTGSGLSPDVAERVFEPFFTTKSTGTGLGLAIVRRITDAHGGEVAIDSAEGAGARVTVTIPRPSRAGAGA